MSYFGEKCPYFELNGLKMAQNSLKWAIGQFYLLGLITSFPTIYNTPYEMLRIPFSDIIRPAGPNRTGPFRFFSTRQKSLQGQIH